MLNRTQFEAVKTKNSL